MTIHSTSIVNPLASIGKDVEIGPYTIVHGNVIIGPKTRIGSHCELGVASLSSDGSPLVFGAESEIRSHSIFYESSNFGSGLVTGHRVTVREFTILGKHCSIGTLTDIQGTCSGGDYVRLHSNVFVSQHTTFRSHIWIFPKVSFTDDPHPPSYSRIGSTIEDFAVIGAKSTILPGITIGEGAFVGAGSVVTKNVGSRRLAFGNPAQDKGYASQIKMRDGTNTSAYPWKDRFHRQFPADEFNR